MPPGEERKHERRGDKESKLYEQRKKWEGGKRERRTQGEELKEKEVKSSSRRGEKEKRRWDLRVEHRAVVVDEAGADELMSGLGGSKAELNDALLSWKSTPRRHRGEHTANTRQSCVCVWERESHRMTVCALAALSVMVTYTSPDL